MWRGLVETLDQLWKFVWSVEAAGKPGSRQQACIAAKSICRYSPLPFDISYSTADIEMARGCSTEFLCLSTVPSPSAAVDGCGEDWLKVHTRGLAIPVERPSGGQASFQSLDIFCGMFIPSSFPFVFDIFLLYRTFLHRAPSPISLSSTPSSLPQNKKVEGRLRFIIIQSLLEGRRRKAVQLASWLCILEA